MATTSPRVGFYLPADDGSDSVDVSTDLNDNFERIDATIGMVPSTSGSPPVAPFDGLTTYETDTGRAKFWRSAASAWNYVLTSGAQFLSNITIATSARFGIGTSSPAALIDIIVASITAVPLLKLKQDSETTHRFEMNADGMRWGGGSVATDTRLYRSSTANLAITGNLTLENNLAVTGTTSLAATGITGSLTLDGSLTSDLTVTGDLSVAGKGSSRFLRKATTTTRASTVTVSNDPEILYSLEANTVYLVEMFLAYRGTTTGDFRSAWSVPAGANGFRWCLGAQVGSTDRENTAMRTGGHNLTSEIVYGGASASITSCGWEVLYITTTTAGTLNFRWAQGTSDASGSSLMEGTFIKVTKVA